MVPSARCNSDAINLLGSPRATSMATWRSRWLSFCPTTARNRRDLGRRHDWHSRTRSPKLRNSTPQRQQDRRFSTTCGSARLLALIDPLSVRSRFRAATHSIGRRRARKCGRIALPARRTEMLSETSAFRQVVCFAYFPHGQSTSARRRARVGGKGAFSPEWLVGG